MGWAIVWMERLHWAVWPSGAHQSGRHQRSRLRLCNDANSMWPSHPWLLRCKGLLCPPVLSAPSLLPSIISHPHSQHATDFSRFEDNFWSNSRRTLNSSYLNLLSHLSLYSNIRYFIIFKSKSGALTVKKLNNDSFVHITFSQTN